MMQASRHHRTKGQGIAGFRQGLDSFAATESGVAEFGGVGAGEKHLQIRLIRAFRQCDGNVEQTRFHFSFQTSSSVRYCFRFSVACATRAAMNCPLSASNSVWTRCFLRRAFASFKPLRLSTSNRQGPKNRHRALSSKSPAQRLDDHLPVQPVHFLVRDDEFRTQFSGHFQTGMTTVAVPTNSTPESGSSKLTRVAGQEVSFQQSWLEWAHGTRCI